MYLLTYNMNQYKDGSGEWMPKQTSFSTKEAMQSFMEARFYLPQYNSFNRLLN